MSHDIDDNSDNPYRPRTLTVGDPHHDAQLLRDVSIINAQTVSRLGPLPHGGLPVQPKRKPNLPQHTPTSAAYPTEDDPMKLHQLAAAAIVPLAVAAAGCSHGIDAGSVTAQLNPHPQKRYEVTATTDAPGPWDSVKGYVSFQVANVDCVPQDSFTGARNVPNISYDFEMNRVDEKTWKGYFYRDALQDEDYFKLGVCHWEVTQASPVFTVHGENFVPGSGLENIKSLTRYFKRSEFADHSQKDAALDFPVINPEYIKSPNAFFPITVTVKEVMP